MSSDHPLPWGHARLPLPKTHLGCRAGLAPGRDRGPDALLLWGSYFSGWFYGLPSASSLSPSRLIRGKFLGLSGGTALRGGDPNAPAAWVLGDTLGGSV